MGEECISDKSVLPEMIIAEKFRVEDGPGYLPPFRCLGGTRDTLPHVMRELGYKSGAEIGVLGGAYSRILCEGIPNLILKCVDPYLPFRRNTAEKLERHSIWAHRRLRGFNVRFIKQPSMDAVREIPDKSLDFVYIDAMHEFDPVMLDLIHWGGKVRSGGMIAGHDYSPPAWHNGVILAVDTYTKAHNIMRWYITDEEDKSYFWVKP